MIFPLDLQPTPEEVKKLSFSILVLLEPMVETLFTGLISAEFF